MDSIKKLRKQLGLTKKEFNKLTLSDLHNLINPKAKILDTFINRSMDGNFILTDVNFRINYQGYNSKEIWKALILHIQEIIKDDKE